MGYLVAAYLVVLVVLVVYALRIAREKRQLNRRLNETLSNLDRKNLGGVAKQKFPEEA